MAIIRAIREAVGRLLPEGWTEGLAEGMLTAFANQAKGI